LLQVVTNLKIGPSVEPKKWHVVVNTLFWLVGTSRNVILVVVAGLVGYHFASNAEPPFKVMGDIPPGLPTPRPPPFGFTETKNGTVLSVDVWEMISDLGSGIIVVPLIAILEDISICKAFGSSVTNLTRHIKICCFSERKNCGWYPRTDRDWGVQSGELLHASVSRFW
jgi:sodium-independent sulfate anion transporter 11